MPDQTNHIPAFQFGKYTVEAWGHRSATAVGGTELIWSIRVDDAWLGSFSASPDLTAPEVMKRVKHWVTQNLPK
jgi:hypothetical protein